MKFNLSKNKVFMGRYFPNTILVLSAFTQSGIALDKGISRQEALNLFNQISWRIIANNKIVDAKEGSWITDERYRESIRNVIGKAIADCITKRNEFANKTADQIITFAADPRKQPYTPENWNAVVLWNLIHVIYCGYFSTDKNYNCNIEKAFDEVAKRVKNEYNTINNINDIVNEAIYDIKEYAKELDFNTEFFWFAWYAKREKRHKHLEGDVALHVSMCYKDDTPQKDPTGEYRYGYLKADYTNFQDKGIKVKIGKRMYAIRYTNINYTTSTSFNIEFLKTLYDGDEEILWDKDQKKYILWDKDQKKYILWDKDQKKYKELYEKICDEAIECLFRKYLKRIDDSGYKSYEINLQDISEMIN